MEGVKLSGKQPIGEAEVDEVDSCIICQISTWQSSTSEENRRKRQRIAPDVQEDTVSKMPNCIGDMEASYII